MGVSDWDTGATHGNAKNHKGRRLQSYVVDAYAGRVMKRKMKMLRCATCLVLTAITMALLMPWPVPVQASDAVPKQVHLIIENKRLIASNVRFSRFDTLKLNAQEKVLDKSVGEAVIVIITDKRFIGYGFLAGWRTVRRSPGEDVQNISVEDFAGLVVTSRRFLNFNGQTGVWGEQKRHVN